MPEKLKDIFKQWVKAKGLTPEREKQFLIGVEIILSNILIGLKDKKHDASKWLLAGTLAFVYAIVSNAEDFFSVYGLWLTKLATSCFAISIFFGLFEGIGGHVLAILSKNERIEKVTSILLEISDDKSEPSISDVINNDLITVDDVLNRMYPDLLKKLKLYFFDLKNFGLQLGFFSLGVGLILAGLLLYRPIGEKSDCVVKPQKETTSGPSWADL